MPLNRTAHNQIIGQTHIHNIPTTTTYKYLGIYIVSKYHTIDFIHKHEYERIFIDTLENKNNYNQGYHFQTWRTYIKTKITYASDTKKQEHLLDKSITNALALPYIPGFYHKYIQTKSYTYFQHLNTTQLRDHLITLNNNPFHHIKYLHTHSPITIQQQPEGTYPSLYNTKSHEKTSHAKKHKNLTKQKTIFIPNIYSILLRNKKNIFIYHKIITNSTIITAQYSYTNHNNNNILYYKDSCLLFLSKKLGPLSLKRTNYYCYDVP